MLSVVDAKGLVKHYKAKDDPALDSFVLPVDEGSISTLLGRNGAGKTTFLRIAS
ncbi:MAG: hypothetical protein JRN06_12030 [Nitrososphaerota archaeon]|nr:hypothetical protein [Nitrososphaerota archaeon]